MTEGSLSHTRVLIIDDDEKLTALLEEYLGGYGIAVQSAAHPSEGLRMIREGPPDLVILDVMLPGMDGFAVCRKVREMSRVPIVMLTARGDVTDKVVGLEMGADDYLSKPFEPRELVARIQAVLRRGTQHVEEERTSLGELEINWAARSVFHRDILIDVTTAEFDLLSVLVHNRGRVLSRDLIMSKMRGVDWESFDRSVDVLISRLRQKLGDDPKRPQFVRTIRGAGYRFVGGTNDGT